MKSIREHRHTFLTLLFLLGIFLIAGSFEARVPESAVAATTPGSQSVQKNADWIFNYGQPDDHNTAAMTQVNYTGEVRKDGALIVSDTKLKPGDQVTLDIFADASYFVTGAWSDSPPAPWVGSDFASKLMPSPWNYRGVFSGKYSYEYKNFPYADYFPNIPADYCSSTHLFNISSVIRAFCMQASVKKSAVSLNTNGMNCGALSESDTAEGQRKYSATCTITTSGPQASLSADIGATSFYYPSRVRESSKVPGTGPSNWESKISGYEPSDHNPEFPVGCLPSDVGENCSGFHVDPGDLDHTSISNFYSAGTIDAATLSWNIDVAPNPPAAPTLTFTGNPTTINQGQSATLTWSSQNTTSCAGTGFDTGGATSGSRTVSPSSNTTYSMTCSGPGGNVSADVTITVNSVCAGSQTKPHNECSNNSCVAVDSCGASSCASSADCQPTCPAGQTKPYSTCQSGSCVATDACGVSNCSSNSQCALPPGSTCSSNSQCQSGICQSGSCVSGPNGPCSSNSQCQTGLVCSGGVCGSCPAGQTAPHNECSNNSCVSASSCGVSACQNNSQCAPQTDFSLSNSGGIAATIVGSSSATSTPTTLTVTPFNNFNSPVNLSVLSVSPPLPSGTQHTFSDSTLTSPEYSTGSVYRVNIPASTTPGAYLITVQGSSGGAIRTATLTLTVNIQNPNFREVFNPFFNPWTKNETLISSLPALLLPAF